MAYEDSPSLENFEQGLPEELPGSDGNHKSLWKVIVALGVLVLVLGAVNFLKSGTMAKIRGTGKVQGVIVNEAEEPIQAEIFVPGTTISAKTDQAGRFEVVGVPSGERSIVVAYAGSAWEYPVQVLAGEVVNMGKLHFMTTVVPED